MIYVSLFASAVRDKLFPYFLDSLKTTKIPIEVIFAGPLPEVKEMEYAPFLTYKYIHTENIKPAQCYEIARRACQGELVHWTCDDAEYTPYLMEKVYESWKSGNNEKLIYSLQTKETGYGVPKGFLFDMHVHRFFGGNNSSPLMAPLGVMSRKFLDEIGGFDRRFICGQYENFAVMMAYAKGAKVRIFGNQDEHVDIDHLGKSLMIGESVTQNDFQKRPFAEGYPNDRKILEQEFSEGRNITLHKYTFEPYEEKDILIKSQSNNLKRWV